MVREAHRKARFFPADSLRVLRSDRAVAGHYSPAVARARRRKRFPKVVDLTLEMDTCQLRPLSRDELPDGLLSEVDRSAAGVLLLRYLDRDLE